MSQYDVEVLILCLVVFVASCAASAFVLTYVFRLETKCIVNGLFDDKIVKVATKKPKKCGKIMLVLWRSRYHCFGSGYNFCFFFVYIHYSL